MTFSATAGTGMQDDAQVLRRIKAAFFLQPVAFGTWLPRIPDVQAALSLTPGRLSLCLLGVSAGILLVLPFGGRIAAALGVRRLLVAGFVLFLAAVPLGSWALGPVGLFLGLMAAGMAMAIVELGLNVGADGIEAATGRFIMNTCHGFWSLGIMTGTAVGALLAWADIPPHIAVTGSAGVALGLALWLLAGFPEVAAKPAPASAGTARRMLPGRRVVGIGLFALGIGMTEGAMADWSAIYLRDSFALASGAAGLGYVAFAGMVTAGRFAGDRLRARLGTEGLARTSVAVALLGVAVVALAPHVALAFLGFVLTGFGVSVGFPLGVTAVAAIPERTPAANVATLSFMALMGFMIGPVMIGGLTDHFGIRVGLGALLAALALSLALVPLLRPAGDRATTGA